MKKIFWALLISILCKHIAFAQCDLYPFTERQDVYTALPADATKTTIESGTLLDFILLSDGTRVPFPDGNSTIAADKAFALGFDFLFGGKTYDRLVISANGFIILGEKGQDQIAIEGVSSDGNMDLPDHAIGLAGKDSWGDFVCKGVDGTAISHKTGEGTFAIEFNKIAYINEEREKRADLTYTLTLSQDNGVAFCFGDINFPNDNRDVMFTMGLRENEDHVHYRVPNDDRVAIGWSYDFIDWRMTSYSKKNAAGQLMIGKLQEAGAFPSGTTWHFSTPKPCETPNTQFEFDDQMMIDNWGDLICNVTVTSPDPNCDGAIVTLSLDEPDETPITHITDIQDDIIYNHDFPKSGWLFEEIDVEPNDIYYMAVYPYNYRCTGDTVFGPMSYKRIVTPTTAPDELAIASCDNEAIELEATANDEDQDIAVVVTPFLDFETSHVYGEDHGLFGSPRSDMKVGDTLRLADGSFGGVVFYIGEADGTIRYTDIEPHTIYYFAAFSKGTGDRYSETYASAMTITPAAFPFEDDFKQQPYGEGLLGWDGTDGFTLVARNRTGIISASANDEPNITLPAMTLPAKEIRLALTYNMSYLSNHMTYGIIRENWSETDSIIVEISQNGGDFQPLYAIDRFNADNFISSTPINRIIPLTITASAEARLRVRWKVDFEENPTLKIENVRLSETPVCDYPVFVNIQDNSITSESVTFDWEPGISEESRWRISYAEMDGNTPQWSEPEEVAEHPYSLDHLNHNTTYQIRVQAACNLGVYSDWTYSSEFTTTWNIPMKEDFNNLKDDGNPYRPTVILNSGWLLKIADLKDTVDLGNVKENAYNKPVEITEWKYSTVKKIISNGSLMYKCSYKRHSWVELPELDFGDGTEGNRLAFDLAVASSQGDPVDSVAQDTYVYIFYASEGEKYLAKDSLLVLDKTALDEACKETKRFTVSLDKLKGRHRLAFFMTATSSYFPPEIYLDNIEVYATCAAAKDLVYADLTESSATISWRLDPYVAEWTVKVESPNGEQSFTTTDNAYALTNLRPATTYTVSVSHLCGDDRTAWRSVTFTTGGTPCNIVTGMTAENITTKTASLKWTGEADAYRLQIRKANTDEWAVFNSTQTTYTVENLTAATAYEWRVQSVCGEAAGDTSAYSETTSFTTLEETCFPPQGLTVTDINFRSATLKWTGDADGNYEISYKTATETAYEHTMEISGTSVQINDLKAKESYSFRIRTLCSESETSAWSEVVTAVTPDVPVCAQPTNLRAEAITETSARLSWEVEGGLHCTLRFRTEAATAWDSVKNLTEHAYLLSGLQPNTVYYWSVMNLCEYDLFSEWSKQASFTTAGVGNEDKTESLFRIYATLGQLHILNPGRRHIERVEILNRIGQLLQTHAIGSDENIIIPTALRGETVIVRVFMDNATAATYKIML